MKAALAIALLVVLVGCDEVIPGPDIPPDNDFFDVPDVPDLPEVVADIGPDLPPASTDQCTLKWAYERQESGVQSHPTVDLKGVTGIAAGDTFRRVDATGQQDEQCQTGFKLAGEHLGSPSQSGTEDYFMGTTSGKLAKVNRKCQERWVADIEAMACPGGQGNPHVCDDKPWAVREAPAIDGGTVYVLDEQPVLHVFSGGGEAPIYEGSYITMAASQTGEAEPLDTAHERGSVAIIDGVTIPHVVFPTRKTVVAVRQGSPAKHWEFSDFLDEASPWFGYEVTSSLAVTSDGKVLFAAGLPSADSHEKQQLFRLLPDSEDNVAVVDAGFPVPLHQSAQNPTGLTLDSVTGIALRGDEDIYISTKFHGVWRLNADGTPQWRFIGDEESLRVESVPAVGDDGAIYFMAEPSSFYGVDEDGKRIFRASPETGGNWQGTSPAIQQDGTVLIHFGTQLRAYECPTQGLSVSSWPRYQRNNRSSGHSKEIN